MHVGGFGVCDDFAGNWGVLTLTDSVRKAVNEGFEEKHRGD